MNSIWPNFPAAFQEKDNKSETFSKLKLQGGLGSEMQL